MMVSVLTSYIVRKIVLLQIIIVFVALSALPVSAEYQDKQSVIESLIAEAIRNNPELRSFENRIEAFEQRPSQERSLDDPRLKLAFLNLPVDTFRFDQEAMTQKFIQVMQKIPYPGKRDLKGDIAEKDIEIATAEFNEKKNSLIRQVKVIYNNLLFLDMALRVTGDTRSLLAEFIKTAETGYAAGTGGQQEILKARMELSRIIKKIISLEQKRETTVAYMNTLLNRPVQKDFHVAGELDQTPVVFTFDELQKIAEENRPVLKGMEEKIEQSRLAINLAEKEYYPDMDFGVSYGQRDDSATDHRPDFISASLSINIPLWYETKERRKVFEKKAQQRRAEEQFNSIRNSIYFRLKELLSQIDMHNQEIDLLETGFIPQSTLSFESAMSGYRVNKIDFLTLINNQISVYNYKIEYYRVIADRENSLIELEETVGRQLF
jgi:outer membrane protein TolC